MRSSALTIPAFFYAFRIVVRLALRHSKRDVQEVTREDVVTNIVPLSASEPKKSVRIPDVRRISNVRAEGSQVVREMHLTTALRNEVLPSVDPVWRVS